ncbi:hypothetical protein VRK_43360 [Vibrio sp. MEBiC08052]|nr:hypothetical protein VRK_43360 [Vibrio sp. MEBiC08052]
MNIEQHARTEKTLLIQSIVYRAASCTIENMKSISFKKIEWY